MSKDFREMDKRFMAIALRLAKKGIGRVSPNPMVGAVITDQQGNILATGYHRRYGDLHAEREALKRLEWKAPGTIMYVNLEPCCHHGKTPPCTEAIIASGIKEVAIGTLDPNPLVTRKGVEILRGAGVRVKTGILEEECRELNKVYFKWITTGLPYVILKWAQSIDGRIATIRGDSRWISGQEALRYAHRLRARADAVLVGRETVDKDDPQLTVRLVKGRNPLRVILDSNLTLSLDRKAFSTPPSTLVFTLSKDQRKIEALRGRGIEVVVLESHRDQVSLKETLKVLGERGIAHLLVEGGGKVITSFLREKLADEIQAIVAPIILGEGRDAVRDLKCLLIDDSTRLKNMKIKRAGRDLIIGGRLTH